MAGASGRREGGMTELRIQGKIVDALPNENLLDCATRHGFEIPSLCHHPALEPYGACRVCLVEVSKKGRSGKVVAACTHPTLAGIDVSLDTPRVERSRKMSIELLLAHAPEARAIAKLAEKYNVSESRFEKVEQPQDCILCGLCERVCREVVHASAISLSGRGYRRDIDVPFDEDSLCIGCGACEFLCPTNVLTMRRSACERFRKLRGEDRLCRYSLMGVLPGALCANDYRCERCETENIMVDRDPEHPLIQAVLDSQVKS